MTLSAPSAFGSAPADEDQQEHLRLRGPQGAVVSVSCLHKSETAPTMLDAHAIWVMRRALRGTSARVERAEERQIDGRPSLWAEVVTDKGDQRSVFVFTERTKAFYWIRYTAPASGWNDDAASREGIVQSFHVIDAVADRGPIRWWHPPLALDARTLTDARASFRTRVASGRPARFDGKPAPDPPRGVFEKVKIRGPSGDLAAYVTPKPADGARHPAVVWAHGGFGGIDEGFWEPAPRDNDQSARAFREAGIVLAVGSWRAENDNAGSYELYYGEVADYLALRDHVARMPYVDPNRIYLAGHSSGGALVLLAAETSRDFRAAFSIGGVTFFEPESYARYSGVPFDVNDKNEMLLRSAAPFVRSVRRPTFYFEGTSVWAGTAQWMADRAPESGTPFKAFVALQANHFSILAPLTELIAKKIQADTGPAPAIDFTQEEIDRLAVSSGDSR